MFTVENVLEQRYPGFRERHPYLRLPILKILRLLFHEAQFRQFEADNPHLTGIGFVDKVLEYFDFSYAVRSSERERLPVGGPVMIVANHPIGSLDGLAVLRLVSEVRPDVKVIANDLLMAIKPLHPLLLPVDAMGGNTARDNIRRIEAHLRDGGAVVMFPAGEVSRLSPAGVRDGRWRSGFLRIARRARADILPVYIDGRNSAFFYSLSLLAKPLSTLLLIREMFRQAQNSVTVRIGHAITPAQYTAIPRDDKWISKRFRKQVYALRKPRRKPLFAPSAKSVAHPENRQILRAEIRRCELLGETRDGKRICLYRHQGDSALMREIGRVRELSFRSVGEGCGERRDTDRYDGYYEHIVLWDEQDLEITGAYRLAHAGTTLAEKGPGSLYTQSLFRFTEAMEGVCPEAVELGRSFVQPRYWGRRGLDYLWYGIGAYVRSRPDTRFLFGPVSISNNYPQFARDLLVCFYRHYFPAAEQAAVARIPYYGVQESLGDFGFGFRGDDYDADFALLRTVLQAKGLQVPTLYKQYTEAVEAGGASFLAFNVDPSFGHCVDGLILVDLHRLRPTHRRRYLERGLG